MLEFHVEVPCHSKPSPRVEFGLVGVSKRNGRKMKYHTWLLVWLQKRAFGALVPNDGALRFRGD